MDQNLTYILFPGSPFYTEVDPVVLDRIKTSIVQRKIHPAVAISYEVCGIGVQQNELQEQEHERIQSVFHSTRQNLDNFMFGFVSAPSLIIGANMLQRLSTQDTFKYLCPPTQDGILISFNAYKSKLLHQAGRIFQSAPQESPLKVSQPIYKLCKLVGFTDDPYFSVGLAASEELYISYVHHLGYS